MRMIREILEDVAGKSCLACGCLGGRVQSLQNLLLQGTMKHAPCCHPHPASCCEPKEWLVCNYVWHSSLCCAVFAPWLLRNWRPPLDKLGAPNLPTLPRPV